MLCVLCFLWFITSKGQAHHTAHAKFGADAKIAHNRFLRVQSSTFWDHVNIVDIVMQVIGTLSNHLFCKAPPNNIGLKTLTFKIFQK